MEYTEKLSAIPPEVLSAADYEPLAKAFIPADIFAYIAGGASDELTLGANRTAFDKLHIVPRVLNDFSAASTACNLLGSSIAHPLLLGPVAHQQLVHREGELATAQAAEATETGLVVSTLSSYTLEDIAATSQSGKWFQLYWQPERDHVLDLLKRAEGAGYTAIVVTVDVPVTALRYREQRAGFVHPPELPAINLSHYPQPASKTLAQGKSVILHGVMAEAPTWQDLDWLRAQTRLPILVKGILSASDAVEVKRRGLDGVIVSNHGGRSLDGAPASIDVLAAIRNSVGNEFTVLLDSGVRRGSDVFKALALGADAVLLGRLQLYALSVAGALGVAHMLSMLKQELEVVMALSGCATISDIRHKAQLQ